MTPSKNKMDRKFVRGLVIPEQWNSAGEVVGVTIQTRQEEIFFVAPDEIGKELLGYMHREIEASGKIAERINGATLITVKKYRPIGAETDQPQNGPR